MVGAYIKKIAYVLPRRVEENPPNRLTRKTGIYRRHIAAEGETAADLAVQAAEKLLQGDFDRRGIDYLLFCTQSPDYPLPTTACILQMRLRLARHCGALDFNLGCSGYVYGLSLAKGLIESGQARCVLFLTAETYSKYIYEGDSAVKPLFGDAATATLIVGAAARQSGIRGVVLGTDGSGYQRLIVPAGGMRKRSPAVEATAAAGRTDAHLRMDGAAISDFALEVVPDAVREVLSRCGLTKADVDYFVFHQANAFMLEFLREKCALLDCPFWNHVEEYGNTVSNSLPIALADLLAVENERALKNVLLAGFGVGLSWGGCMADLQLIGR